MRLGRGMMRPGLACLRRAEKKRVWKALKHLDPGKRLKAGGQGHGEKGGAPSCNGALVKAANRNAGD